MNILITVFLSCVILAQSQELKCYNCQPTDAGNCTSPAANNIQSTLCKDTYTPENGSPIVSGVIKFQCFSFYLNAVNDSRGFYRGCTSRIGDISVACEVFLKQFAGLGVVTQCRTCETDRCNFEGDSEGDKEVPAKDSGVGYFLSLYCIILSLLAYIA